MEGVADKRGVAVVDDCSGDTLSIMVDSGYGLSDDFNTVEEDNEVNNVDDVSIEVRRSVAGVDVKVPLCVNVATTVDVVSDSDNVGLIVNSTLSLLLDERLVVPDDATEEVMTSLCATDEKDEIGDEMAAPDEDSDTDDAQVYGTLADSVPLAD